MKRCDAHNNDNINTLTLDQWLFESVDRVSGGNWWNKLWKFSMKFILMTIMEEEEEKREHVLLSWIEVK